jgi:hypothetical protein
MNLVVSVIKSFWKEWIAEGDAAGDPPTGEEWGYFIGGRKPNIQKGDRLYIVAHGRLRGYAPVTALSFSMEHGKHVICREGNAVAVTIDQPIKGFQGWRYVWWKPEDEKTFPNWKTEGVV